MKRTIDIHTHAFPEKIAKSTMDYLESEADVKAALDGTLAALLGSMERAGIRISVLSSIATKITQFDSILKWSKEAASDRIISFPSVHPDDPELLKRIDIIFNEGFKGIKLHPYYQNFTINEKRLFPFYKQIEEYGLIILFHTGFDIAFEKYRIADPEKIIDIRERFPNLLFIASHIGAWEDWDEVEKHIIGKEIYIDLAYSLNNPALHNAKELLLSHPKEFILFGSDSPWAGQAETIRQIKQLGLGEEIESHIFYKNAERLLKLN
jgi:predicted TIM-barrel fold metal-dependent hydrolase